MPKNWTRAELLRKFGETGADDARDSNPRIGYPPKPLHLPRSISRKWNEAALKLFRRGLLWTWSYDGTLLVDLVTSSPEEQAEIAWEFVCRQPNMDPMRQLQERENHAAYWKHFSTQDIDRLRLTGEETAALKAWVASGTPAGAEIATEPPAVPPFSWDQAEPGIPPTPEGLTDLERVMWKLVTLWVLCGMNDEMFAAQKSEAGAQHFFVDQLQKSLKYLHRGLSPRV